MTVRSRFPYKVTCNPSMARNQRRLKVISFMLAVPEQIAILDVPEPAPCELTILMPCLNEAETLATCVDKARRYLESRHIDGEVLVADNGSTDGSPLIAQARGARVVSVHQRGYGAALMGGIAAARGHYVIMADSDNSYDFTTLDPFLEKLREGYELVMGNRFEGAIQRGAMPALHRYFGNPALTTVGKLLYKSPVGDFHCGLRGFRREAIRQLGLITTGMEFASEMVVKATLYGLRMAEVPTTLAPDGRSKPPHLRSWRDGWRHLRFLLLLSPRWLFLYPGIFLMLGGVTLLFWLLPGSRTLGAITLDVNTLAFSAAGIVCGFQAIMFSMLAKVHAMNSRLLPEDPRVNRFCQVFTLEAGIVLGLLLFSIGLMGSLYAVGSWGFKAFGPLDPASSLRLVIPALTCLMLGFQVVTSSFFLCLLRLKSL